MRHTDCVRVIRMNLDDSLYALHDAIQRAVSFDDDHLFSFTVGAGMMKRTYLPSEAMNRNTDLSVATLLTILSISRRSMSAGSFSQGLRRPVSAACMLQG